MTKKVVKAKKKKGPGGGDQTSPRAKANYAVKAEKQMVVFLDSYSKSGNMTAGCREAGFGRQQINRWLSVDLNNFVERFEIAGEESIDLLEAEARRRAVDGVDEPVVYMGKITEDSEGKPVTIKKYSDTLLHILLRGHRKKFRQSGVEVSDPDNVFGGFIAALNRSKDQ